MQNGSRGSEDRVYEHENSSRGSRNTAAGLQNFDSSADAVNLKSKKEVRSRPATPAAAGLHRTRRCQEGRERIER